MLGPDGQVQWIIHRVEDVTELVQLRSEGAARDKLAREQKQVITELRGVDQELAKALDENLKLQAEKLYLADVVLSSGDAIVVRTPEGIITAWNPAAERMFGYAASEIIGHPATILRPTDQPGETADALASLPLNDTLVNYETRRIRKDGTAIMVTASASPVRNHLGETIGTSVILRDITEQRRTQEQLKGLQSELAHVARWNTMGMMASAIAHELNQPLTAVVNYVRAAQRMMENTPEQRAKVLDFLDKAVSETKLAGGIIRSLREFIEKRESTRVLEDINKVVQEAIALSLAGGPDSRVKIEVILAPTLPAVMIDKIQIEQVLLNLIRNAADAMQPEPGKILVRTGLEGAGHVHVSVLDTGPGVAPGVADRLFEPFVSSKEKGMGIGLTICQSIIEAHGGRIWMEPNEPRGAAFRFRLPASTEARP